MAVMSPAGLIASSLAPVIDLVFPPRCPACGDALGTQEGLCTACWGELVIPGETASGEGAVHAATVYGETSRKLLLAFKHGGRMTLAPMLARMIAARLPAPDSRRLLVPVPLHRWRLWRRGYNQAALLAGELARLGHGVLLVDALERHRATPSLGGLGAEARTRALKGTIRATRRREGVVKGREIVLVDDVLTSGATAAACTAALREAGARKVEIACFARVEISRQRP